MRYFLDFCRILNTKQIPEIERIRILREKEGIKIQSSLNKEPIFIPNEYLNLFISNFQIVQNATVIS